VELTNIAADARYDTVVIGSGASGLTCALALAQAGQRVLLAEKNDWVGGLSHGFSQDGFYWDHGGHIFLAYRLGGQAREVFQRLGIDERIEMNPDRHDYTCNFPDDAIYMPADITEASDAFSERFPEEREGTERLMLTMERLLEEAFVLVPALRVAGPRGERRKIDPILEQFTRKPVGKFGAKLAGAFGAPGATLLRYQFSTYSEMLDEYIKNPRLKAYFSMFSAGIGTGPGELSAVVAALFMISALNPMWMPRGGFSKIAETLAAMFEEAGGTIATGAEVGKIVVENGRAAGVETLDGRRFTADTVVSAADARRTFLNLLPPNEVPADLRERLPKLDLTQAWFQVFLGLDMDLAPLQQSKKLGRLNFIYPSDDLDSSMAKLSNGELDEASFMLYVATLHQPEMAPAGKQSIKLEASSNFRPKGLDWERDKEMIADKLAESAERVLPGLRQSVIARLIRTPVDMERDTYNTEGAYCGWGWTPKMLTRERPQPRSPVKGLYLTGHWTTPTAGVPWVMMSGYNTAGMILGDRKVRK
jgi:phytoene dehydrogenase-like protein